MNFHIDYWQEHQYECQMKNEMIEKEMYKMRDNALSKISYVISSPKTFPMKEFALTLAYGYFESFEPSEKLTNALDLKKIEYLAIMEKFDAFKEEYEEVLKYYEESFLGEV